MSEQVDRFEDQENTAMLIVTILSVLGFTLKCAFVFLMFKQYLTNEQ